MPPKKSMQARAEKRSSPEQQRVLKSAKRRTGGGARDGRKRMAEETVRITETGVLPLLEGEMDISPLVQESVAGTCSYSEDANVPSPIPKKNGIVTTFQVVNTTTLNAAYSVLEKRNDQGETTTTDKKEEEEGVADENAATGTSGSTLSAVAVLNFASAKNPGGGFLRGSIAQEESLALHSGLYACLKDDEMYAFHRNSKQTAKGIYSDWIIFSPNIPVFRREGDGSLMEPWPCSMITCPCNNNNADKKFGRKNTKGSTNAEQGQLLKKRAKRMLEVVAAHHEGPLVLGAWGCGVFGQDPNVVARIFSELLRSEKEFVYRWPIVIFAVLDRSRSLHTLRAFENVFGAAIEPTPLARASG